MYVLMQRKLSLSTQKFVSKFESLSDFWLQKNEFDHFVRDEHDPVVWSRRTSYVVCDHLRGLEQKKKGEIRDIISSFDKRKFLTFNSHSFRPGHAILLI